MNHEDRKNALEGLKNNRIQVATSCGVLCEGFDEPSVDAVLMVRPTKSETLYVQCVGRGLRKHVGKEDCLVLDFSDRGHNPTPQFRQNNITPQVNDHFIDISNLFNRSEVSQLRIGGTKLAFCRKTPLKKLSEKKPV